MGAKTDKVNRVFDLIELNRGNEGISKEFLLKRESTISLLFLAHYDFI
jgi:hypothetical protein